MPSLRQYAYLVAIADHRSFRRAADAKHVSQPTLSQQLRALEQHLGVTLVERNEHPVQLTPIGREVADRARRLLLAVDDIEQLTRRTRDGMAGTVRLGVTPTLGPYLLPPIIARIHRQFPDTRLYIREGIPDEQAQDLMRGELDMLLSPLPVTGSRLHIEPLFREPLHVVAPPDHELAQRPSLSKRDMAGTAFLGLEPRHHSYRQTRAVCEEFGADLLRDYEGTSLDSLRQMAGSGLGFALLPELYLRAETPSVEVVVPLRITDWQLTRSIGAIWREGSAFSVQYQTLADIIATEAQAIFDQPF